MKTKISNIGKIVTWNPRTSLIDEIKHHQILIEDGKIIQIAKEVSGAEIEIDADNALITPGFIDSHTHPIFYGNRGKEFGMRVGGMSYEEIAKNGGGIVSSLNGVRNASEDELFEYCLNHCNFFLDYGTTTIEAKSGYGLTLEDELKSLRIIKKINEESPLDLIPTFMGAHDFPPELKDDKDRYVRIICEEMIPAVSEENLAVFCDVFCEKGYFEINHTRKILETAIRYGLKPRIHADEFIDSNAAELAAEMGALSADHLMAVSDKGIKALAKNNVTATLLPGTTLFLGKNTYANGRKLIDMGCTVAIATDFNPGSCTLQSMPMVMALSTLYCGLTMEEAFVGSTFNNAKSLELEKSIGLIKEGYLADLLFWEFDSIDEIPYWMGTDRLLTVMKNGELIESSD
jgi:imidazolonepropionase